MVIVDLHLTPASRKACGTIFLPRSRSTKKV